MFDAGDPTFIVEAWSSEEVVLPHSRRVLEVPEADAEVSHAWLQLDGRRCSVWLLNASESDKDPRRLDARRRLRIHLLRLHAERECLRLTLNRINDDSLPLTDPKRLDAVQYYLTEVVRSVEKQDRFGIAQTPLLDAARHAYGLALGGHAASLLGQRKKVAALVQAYIERENSKSTITYVVEGDLVSITLGNVTVTGDFNVVTATNITNSFNKAAQAPVDAQLKERLQALALEIANLAKALPAEEAEKVSTDLGVLTTEVTSKKPRKAWYELSAAGLLEAAKTVAAMTGPVTTAVKAVLALVVG